MAPPSQMLVCTLVVTAVAATSAAAAAAGLPASTLPADAYSPRQLLDRRAIMKGDNYVPLGHTKVPLTPLLLIFCALGFSVVAILYALINVLCTSNRLSRTGRQVDEERARARQDLRVRGDIRRNRGGSPTAGSSSSLENQGGTRQLQPNKIPKRIGGAPGTPRSTNGSKRASRGYRGTSFSLADARKNSDKSRTSSLGLPILNTTGLSSGSTIHVSPQDLETGEQAKLPLSAAAGQRANSRVTGPSDSSKGSRTGARPYYRSSSVGLGADTQKSRQSYRGSIPVNPSAMDRTYAAGDPGHPLGHSHDPLRRQITDPSGSLSASRRNSNLSVYDSASSEGHSFLESVVNSRMGSVSLANSNPLQPLNSPPGGYYGGSGTTSPKATGYSTPAGATSPNDLRSTPAARAYDSDEADSITAHSGLLWDSTVKSPVRRG